MFIFLFGLFYFFLLGSSSGMKTLTVKSPLSVPYLFFTRMLYLPESDVLTLVMVKLANLPDSNLRMKWSLETISRSFFSQVTSGTGSPKILQVRFRHYEKRGKRQFCYFCVIFVFSSHTEKHVHYLALLDGHDIRQTTCHTSTICQKQQLDDFQYTHTICRRYKYSEDLCMYFCLHLLTSLCNSCSPEDKN